MLAKNIAITVSTSITKGNAVNVLFNSYIIYVEPSNLTNTQLIDDKNVYSACFYFLFR